MVHIYNISGSDNYINWIDIYKSDPDIDTEYLAKSVSYSYYQRGIIYKYTICK